MSVFEWDENTEEYEYDDQKNDILLDWEPSAETLRAIGGIYDASDEWIHLDEAVERLSHIEWLQPSKWKELDNYQRRVALEQAGRELAEVYHCPAPSLLAGPLLAENLPPNELGIYDDERFVIVENFNAQIEGQILNDDPSVALETYAHEFRHAYQRYQVSLYDFNPRLVEDLDRVIQWKGNFQEYKDPQENFEEYYTQPVERDARKFATQLVRKIYD